MKNSRLILNDQFKIFERDSWSTNMAGMDNSKEDSDE